MRFFRRCRACLLAEQLAGGHVEIAEQAECAVTRVFVLPPRDATRSRQSVRCDSFHSLDARLLVDRDRVNILLFRQSHRFAVGGAEGGNLRVEFIGIGRLGKQPILVALRLEVGPIKKAPTRLAEIEGTTS